MNTQQKRDIWLIAVFRTISAVGDEVALFAFGLHFAPTPQKWMLGLLGLATVLPMIAISPLSGLLVDRYPVRRILGIVGLAQALAVVALVFVRHPAGILALVSLLSCGVGITQPGYGSLIAHIVPSEEMGAVQGRLSAINSVSLMMGPPIAGFLYAAVGLRGSLVVDAVTFVVIGFATFFLHHDRVPHVDAAKEKGAIARGIKAIFGDGVLRPVVIQTMLFIFIINMVGIVEVVLITQDFGASARVYGFTVACFGLGNFAGALLNGRLPIGDLNQVRRLLIGCFMIGAAEAVIGWLPTVNLVFLLMFLAGIGVGVANASAGTLLVSRIPVDVRGRALAASNAAFNSASVLSMAVGSVVVTLISARAIFQIAGVGATLVALILGPIALRQARRSEGQGDVRNLSQPATEGS